jgi:general stress protein CsbA
MEKKVGKRSEGGENRAVLALKELLPLFVGMLIVVFIKNEWLIAVVLLCVIGVSFYIEYHKYEWFVLVLGVLVGLVLEGVGIHFYKLQYWSEGSVWGMPVWLPILWGYGFVFIRRVGNIIVLGKRGCKI